MISFRKKYGANRKEYPFRENFESINMIHSAKLILRITLPTTKTGYRKNFE